MAYFLKKTNNKKGVYLQIYESHYDPEKKGTAHSSYKALGYLKDLTDSGIEDPISFYQAEVDELNRARKVDKDSAKRKKISDESPERYLGYFLFKSINTSLGVEKYINLLQLGTGFGFSVYQMLSSLIYSRVVMPCSKLKTFHDVLPCLFEKADFSLDQLYSGLKFIGSEYEKIIEIYNHQVSSIYPFDTMNSYFDCTNFFFEIDKEDDLRRKGPSKENRTDPIVGLGLLLDANQIPMGMKIYPGNESEKPVLREVISELKKRHNINGRTIHVADKGLNCAENIVHALKNGDGYIFSKSVKQLPATEKTWVLLENDYKDICDKDGKLLFKLKECVDDFTYEIHDDQGKKKKIKLPEKRIVSYNPSLAKKKKIEILRQVEKAKRLSTSAAKKNEFGDSSKYVIFKSTDEEGKASKNKVCTEINQKAIDEDLALAGYNMIVTSERNQSARSIYDAYHNLWRIEESFRIMKSQLDARPVFVRNKDAIKGHFLICYLAVLIMRLLQFKVFKNQYSSEEVISLIKGFKVVQISDRKYVNITKTSNIIKETSLSTALPLDCYYLSKGEIENILKYKITKKT